MYTLIRLAGSILLASTITACVSQHSIKNAARKVESRWQTQNGQILEKEGRRSYAATKHQGFAAVQRAAGRLGMVIENQTYETGFVFMSAPAPAPLTAPEWEQVQAAETRAMRDLVSRDLGVYQWWVTLDPSGKEVLGNVFITENPDGINVSLGLRLRVKESSSDRLKRLQPPPTALRMGLAKFWSAYEAELDNLLGTAPCVSPPQPAREAAPAGSPATPPQPRQPGTNPDAVAVIIGNRTYGRQVPPVEFAHQDADAWADFATGTLGVLPDNVITLKDASLKEMEAVLGNTRSHEGTLWRWSRPLESDLFIFYSGHGLPGQKDRQAYLLPVDTHPDRVELEGYPLTLLYANLEKMEARSVTVFIDACFSGQSPGGQLVRNASGIRVVPAQQAPAAMAVISAARADQMASWDRAARQGLFTRHLLLGLNGAADQTRYGNADGFITLQEVHKYLDREMSYAARRQYGRTQQAAVFGDPNRVLIRLPSE